MEPITIGILLYGAYVASKKPKLSPPDNTSTPYDPNYNSVDKYVVDDYSPWNAYTAPSAAPLPPASTATLISYASITDVMTIDKQILVMEGNVDAQRPVLLAGETAYFDKAAHTWQMMYSNIVNNAGKFTSQQVLDTAKLVSDEYNVLVPVMVAARTKANAAVDTYNKNQDILRKAYIDSHVISEPFDFLHNNTTYAQRLVIEADAVKLYPYKAYP